MRHTAEYYVNQILEMLNVFGGNFKGNGYELSVKDGNVSIKYDTTYVECDTDTMDIYDCSIPILNGIVTDMNFQKRVFEFEQIEEDDLENIEVRTASELPNILREMADYLDGCKDNGEDLLGYFKEIVETGAFNDACGKELGSKDDVIIVTTCY